MFGQQRSQSGPTGLSINTGSANLFGASSSNNASQAPSSNLLFGTPKSGGLFGSSNTASTASQGGSLFGTTNVTSASQGGGLFGSSTATTSTTQGGGLFGSSTATTSTPLGGGLFGSSTATTSAPQGGGLFATSTTNQGGLFGAQANQSGQTQQQGTGLFGNQTSQQAGSLFGSSTAQQSAPQQTGGGLFGSLNQTQNQASVAQQPQANSLFGGLNKAPLFGNQSQNQNQQRPANFAQSQQPQQSLFSSSIGQYSQQQQTVPGVRIDISGLKPTTRFNDLHEDVQKVIAQVDGFILAQMQNSDECEQAMPKVASALEYIPGDVEFCSNKLDAFQQALENDASAIDNNKNLVRKDAADARLSFKAIQNLRMPQQFHHAGLWNAPSASQNVGPVLHDINGEEEGSADLVSYFSKQADEMGKTLDSFNKTIAEVESYLKGVEANTLQQVQRVQFTRSRDGGQRSADDQIRELAAVLREFENGILGVAGKVGGVREQVQETMLGEGISSRGRRRGPY